jgi:hypothetical protein
MVLREGEEILKKYRHHPTPFIWIMIKTLFGVAPFYLFLFFAVPYIGMSWNVILHAAFFVLLAIIVIYKTLVYWLDILIVTNQRIINIDYKFLTTSNTSQTFITDIQDINTKEKGILSYLWIFDYGTISIETAASDVTLVFCDAPDPEGIRQQIFHIRKQ